ncbi:hypothetical protein CGRA01v4_14197 [Colletotrichum graminicola]|uniref:Uncharacterized protein n=1 Tax=Colletotrichum graminicola (strain M1.001 / M2 / FGSC 10212) TaxID=645133 RepID=E3Q531_COLGM|nr:uncharacterized protein GLRG_00942 [Colletotrichum graminicola M1.001]EFQ25798.1 hypothetical protein GLRG_00942 [Colletotrichum graminicola M1.001]WDK22906.1 hypothetical protein CGRA01v4_14197 [Colletotrichum graminicola]
MDEFCVRLLSFFERGTDGKPGRWPHPALSPEDMAGAGFRLQGSQAKLGDNVICDFCRLQAWKWETKDDPYHQHQEASPKCGYVTSDIFKEHHDVFLQKQPDVKGVVQWPLSPPPTPTKRSCKPRRRMGLSPIMTVCESTPFKQETKSVKLQDQSQTSTISVTAGCVEVFIRVYDQGGRGKFPALIIDFEWPELTSRQTPREFALSRHDAGKILRHNRQL